MNGTVNAHVDGSWQASYTAEEFRLNVLDKIAKENIWHHGYSKYLDCVFSTLSSMSVSVFAEEMSLIDCVWKGEESGWRIEIGGERGDGFYFVIKIGPKYGLSLHGIGEPKYFDAKSCQIDNGTIQEELARYLGIVVKGVRANKEFNDALYKAKMMYTTALDLLGINVNWKDSNHTELR